MRQRPAEGYEAARTVPEWRIVELLILHGWAFEARTAGRNAAESAARRALQSLIDAGLACRQTGAEPCFDPAEVVSWLAWSNATDHDPDLAERCLANGRGLAWQAAGLAPDTTDPPPLDPGAARRIRVRLRRRFDLAAAASSRRLRLRLPAPIEDARLTELTVRPLRPSERRCEVRAAPAALDFLIDPNGAETVEIGAEFTFTARAWVPDNPVPPLSAEEAEIYLRPREGLVRLGDSARRLAESLGPASTRPSEAIRRLRDWIFDGMACGAPPYEALDPADPFQWPIAHGWFDCQLGAALIVAVCRARGVPARLAGGYILAGASPFQHHWAEAWLPDQGWTPFDLWAWDLSAGGRDDAWRDYLFGRLDPRMTTQRLPRLFNGAGDVRLPAVWRVISRAAPHGVETDVYDALTGALAWREWIEVTPA